MDYYGVESKAVPLSSAIKDWRYVPAVLLAAVRLSATTRTTAAVALRVAAATPAQVGGQSCPGGALE
jgi:hypothetical protein